MAAASAFYYWIMRGRVYIPKDFDHPHVAEKWSRHKIAVKNLGYKTLQGLTPRITLTDVTQEDIIGAEEQNLYFVSRNSFTPIVSEVIVWTTQLPEIDLHPKQSAAVDLLHYQFQDKSIIIPSEQGYPNASAKGRTRIVKLRPYNLTVQFFAQDYRSREYRFQIVVPLDGDDISIKRIR